MVNHLTASLITALSFAFASAAKTEKSRTLHDNGVCHKCEKFVFFGFWACAYHRRTSNWGDHISKGSSWCDYDTCCTRLKEWCCLLPPPADGDCADLARSSFSVNAAQEDMMEELFHPSYQDDVTKHNKIKIDFNDLQETTSPFRVACLQSESGKLHHTKLTGSCTEGILGPIVVEVINVPFCTTESCTVTEAEDLIEHPDNSYFYTRFFEFLIEDVINSFVSKEHPNKTPDADCSNLDYSRMEFDDNSSDNSEDDDLVYVIAAAAGVTVLTLCCCCIICYRCCHNVESAGTNVVVVPPPSTAPQNVKTSAGASSITRIVEINPYHNEAAGEVNIPIVKAIRLNNNQ